MWNSTNSGTFTLSYNDGSFSAQGSFGSAGNFGEMGFERNGSFVDGGSAAAGLAVPNQPNAALAQNTQSAQQPPSGPKFRGKLPTRELVH